MISKKVCLLGAFSTGKTSLIEKFVHSIFTDKYLSTVGVKISKKTLAISDKEITLVLWDMEGQDPYTKTNISFLRGAMGYFVVLDGLRQETCQVALELHEMAKKICNNVPCYFLINKVDLQQDWEITPAMIEEIQAKGIKTLLTSAKTGQGVETAFTKLSQEMCEEAVI